MKAQTTKDTAMLYSPSNSAKPGSTTWDLMSDKVVDVLATSPGGVSEDDEVRTNNFVSLISCGSLKHCLGSKIVGVLGADGKGA
jgi:hypothetical protein